MNSTGVIRKIDELGRIVIPIEIRNSLEIQEKDAIQIWVNNKEIVLRKHQINCVFCGSYQKIEQFMEKQICKSCKDKIKNN